MEKKLNKGKVSDLDGAIRIAERVPIFALFCGLWIFVQLPVLNILLFDVKAGLVMFPLSMMIVLALRYRRGGMKEVHRELQTVATDLWFPVSFVQYTFEGADAINTGEWTQELLRGLSVLSKYLFMYGPISLGGLLILAAPIFCILLPILFPQSWFPVLQWATIAYCCMMFCGVATNACMHRYFSHGSFKANRCTTFGLGVLGCLGGQFGPLWWASNHRRHHKFCETELDVHSPAIHGFWYSHCGWFMDVDNFPIRPEYLPRAGKDWPELMVLDVFCTNIQIVFLFCVARLLHAMHVAPPEAGEQGSLLRLVAIGIPDGYELDVISPYVDMALILGYSLFLHFEFFINSWCHSWEHKEKKEDSCSPCKGLDFYWVGLLNAGEGFHANHHQFPAEALHGPKWYFDWSYTFIAAMEKMGLVWDVVRSRKTSGDVAASAR